MKKIIKAIIASKPFLLGVVPICLLLGSFILTYLYIIRLDTTFSILSYNEPLSSFSSLYRGKLTKGKSISGIFTASDNNLGIISVRFQTFFRPAYQNEDELLFQIKEKNSHNVYYQNVYRDGTIYDVPFFPFGFPVIHNSKGKVYEFTITSLNGNENNSVALSGRGQILATKYKYTKAELLQNKKFLFNFAVKKFTNDIQTTDVLFSSLVYILPLFYYLLLLVFWGTIEKQLRRMLPILERLGNHQIFLFLSEVDPADRVLAVFFDTILLFAAFLDTCFLQLGNDYVYLLIALLWFIVQEYFNLSSKLTFAIGIILLLLPPLLYAISLELVAEQVVVYSFLLLSVACIQEVIGFRK